MFRKSLAFILLFSFAGVSQAQFGGFKPPSLPKIPTPKIPPIKPPEFKDPTEYRDDIVNGAKEAGGKISDTIKKPFNHAVERSQELAMIEAKNWLERSNSGKKKYRLSNCAGLYWLNKEWLDRNKLNANNIYVTFSAKCLPNAVGNAMNNNIYLSSAYVNADSIIVNGQFNESTYNRLFQQAATLRHELEHVYQFDRMGFKGFARSYFNGVGRVVGRGDFGNLHGGNSMEQAANNATNSFIENEFSPRIQKVWTYKDWYKGRPTVLRQNQQVVQNPYPQQPVDPAGTLINPQNPYTPPPVPQGQGGTGFQQPPQLTPEQQKAKAIGGLIQAIIEAAGNK